jgi:hypothetical protein
VLSFAGGAGVLDSALAAVVPTLGLLDGAAAVVLGSAGAVVGLG